MTEFEHGVWVGVSSAHTADGRQLGENNTAPSRFKEIIDTEYRLCKFPDSRNGGMINWQLIYVKDRKAIPMTREFIEEESARLRERSVVPGWRFDPALKVAAE